MSATRKQQKHPNEVAAAITYAADTIFAGLERVADALYQLGRGIDFSDIALAIRDIAEAIAVRRDD